MCGCICVYGLRGGEIISTARSFKREGCLKESRKSVGKARK